MALPDPYRYFRIEAAELAEAIGRDLLALGRSSEAPAALERILRAAHTLKGAARVVGHAAIADLTHDLETDLVPLRGQEGAVARPLIDAALALRDAIGHEVAAMALAPAAPAADPLAAASSGPQLESVRVPLGETDALLAGLAEARTRADALREEAAGLRRAHAEARGLARALDGRASDPHEAPRRAEALAAALAPVAARMEATAAAADALLRDLQARAQAMRLLPASVAFADLERACDDAARPLGKAVAFRATGGETRLDGPTLLALRDALGHVVRNAVAHGVEAPAARLAAGKPAEGRVYVHMERRGERIAFTCHDDGAGLDPARLRAEAAARGLLDPAAAAALDDEGALALAFLPGLSTARSASALAGHGIGLDAVRATVRGLGGTIAIASRPGHGTTVTAEVPLPLAALPALMLGAGAAEAALPLAAVAAVLPPRPPDAVGGRETIPHEGAAIPYLPLARAFGQAAGPPMALVLVTTSAGPLALAVERLAGPRDLVVRPLPAHLAGAARAFTAGVALAGDGLPLPVLDPAGLPALADVAVPPPAPAPPRAPILVVDDSPTTRMLEQAILEAAGYDVDLAASVEEALVLARGRSHALYVVDVEMPGLDGHAFVRMTRADPRLAGTPAIMLSSRAEPAELARAQAAGAAGYVIKGEFDQARFLALVRSLAG